MSKPGAPFAEVKPLMRTYDLLLFKGTDLVSKAIRKIEAHEDGPKVKQVANFSHVGLVIRGIDLMPTKDEAEAKWLKSDEVYVLESTMSGDLADGCKDVHGDTHLGVQLRVLKDVVDHYDKPKDSRIAWCAINVPFDGDRRTARHEYEKYRGLRYDLSAIDLGACAFPALRPIRDNTIFEHIRDAVCKLAYGKKRADDDGDGEVERDNVVSNWQFCSEMAANVYKDIGLLPESVNPSNAMPSDFVTDPDDPRKTLDSDHEIIPLFTKPMFFHA